MEEKMNIIAPGASSAIDAATISRIARLARLAPDEDEKKQLQDELGRIIAYFQRLQQLETENIEPAYHPHDLANQFRDDAVVQPASREDFLRLTVSTKDGCLMVPRTVE